MARQTGSINSAASRDDTDERFHKARHRIGVVDGLVSVQNDFVTTTEGKTRSRGDNRYWCIAQRQHRLLKVIEDSIYTVEIVTDDKIEYILEVDAAGEMLGIIVDEQGAAVGTCMPDGFLDQLHRVAVQGIRLAVKFNQAQVAR